MTVKVTKDALNLREKLSELDKPSGIAGQDILKADTPQEVFNYIGAGRRNLIINGAMQVAQRGTSVASAGYFYNLDRWQSYGYSGASTTVSQQAFTVGQTDVPNAKYFARIASTNNQCYIQTKIEDVHTAENSTVTLSFYAKSSDISTLRATMYQSFGSGGSGQETTSSQSNSITSSWQKFVLNFSLPSISGKTVGTGSYVGLWFDTSGTTGTVDIAQVQLEVGSVATPFEHRSYGEELALCQRYYQIVGDTLIPFLSAGTVSTSVLTCMTHIPIQMRSQPTITQWGDAGATSKQFANSTNDVVARMTNINDYTGDISTWASTGYGNRTIFTYLNMADSASTRMAPVYTRCDAEL